MSELINTQDLTHHLIWKDEDGQLVTPKFITKAKFLAIKMQIEKPGRSHVIMENEGYIIPKNDVRVRPLKKDELERAQRKYIQKVQNSDEVKKEKEKQQEEMNKKVKEWIEKNKKEYNKIRDEAEEEVKKKHPKGSFFWNASANIQNITIESHAKSKVREILFHQLS